MNKHEFSGKWHEMKGKVKAKWGELTDDDIALGEGRMEELVGKIQQKYGGSKEQIMRDMNSL